MDTTRNTCYGLGGYALEHISKIIVRLEKGETPGQRRARLVKHRSRPEGALFGFEITEDGIQVKP
jgi:DNA repair protein RadB